MKTKQLATLFFSCLLGILPVAAAAQPFVISADGSEVTDQHTGLIWRRCVEGMSWNSTTCAGTPTTLTHEAALTWAANQASSTGVAWRLPNIKELASIADRSLQYEAIDPTAFPNTPQLTWSSSPYVGGSNYAWVVSFDVGVVGSWARSAALFVRLVRVVRVEQPATD